MTFGISVDQKVEAPLDFDGQSLLMASMTHLYSANFDHESIAQESVSTPNACHNFYIQRFLLLHWDCFCKFFLNVVLEENLNWYFDFFNRF